MIYYCFELPNFNYLIIFLNPYNSVVKESYLDFYNPRVLFNDSKLLDFSSIFLFKIDIY